jgi:succinate dehydrogenase / fumarate reductase cytochrome b subunit
MPTLYGSSIGKKVCMALSGVLLFGFTVVHMLGTLKAFQGREAFDGYSAFLREVGYPLVPHFGVLWLTRIALLAAVSLHIVSALLLWRQSREARKIGYRSEVSQVFSYASRTMRWGGIIILLFIVFHVLHLTIGTLHPEFGHDSPYDNLVLGFQSLPVVAFYLLAVGALALHLYHGVWSVFVTLGTQNPKVQRVRRSIAAVSAVAIFAGYAAIPVAILAGIITL